MCTRSASVFRYRTTPCEEYGRATLETNNTTFSAYLTTKKEHERIIRKAKVQQPQGIVVLRNEKDSPAIFMLGRAPAGNKIGVQPHQTEAWRIIEVHKTRV